MEVARSKNTIPLPAAKPHCGVRLPPDRYCLSACNYKLKSIKKNAPKGAASTASTGPRMGGLLGANKTAARPSPSAVRAQVPRPVIKMNVGQSAVAKIQISVPAQPLATTSEATAVPAVTPTVVAPAAVSTIIKPEPERGIKREREEDDYDAP